MAKVGRKPIYTEERKKKTFSLGKRAREHIGKQPIKDRYMNDLVLADMENEIQLSLENPEEIILVLNGKNIRISINENNGFHFLEYEELPKSNN